MKNYQSRIKRLEDLTQTQTATTDSDDAGDIFKVLRRAAKEGDIHAMARLEVFEKLRTVLSPSFKAADAAAATVPGEFKWGTERYRVWQKEMQRRDSHNYQLFEGFWIHEIICPDDEDPENYLRRPFVDCYTDRLETEPFDRAKYGF